MTHARNQVEHDSDDSECGCEDCFIDRLVAAAPLPTPSQAARLARLLGLSGRCPTS